MKQDFLVQHQSRKCNCRFSGNVRNSTQKLNHDKYWCKCKEFVDRRSSEKGCMWNPSTSDYQCHKTCCIG